MTVKQDTVTLPRAEYEALLERLDELDDRLSGAKALADYEADPRSFLPLEMVERILDGESPVRVWRERRGIKLGELAAAAGLTAAYVSEIEHGRKSGSIDAFRKLGRVLRVTIDDLLAEPRG